MANHASRLALASDVQGPRFGYRLSVALVLALALVTCGAVGLAIGTTYAHATEARYGAK